MVALAVLFLGLVVVVPVVQVVLWCCPALGQSRCLLRQCGTEGGLTLSGWVGAHHTGDELN